MTKKLGITVAALAALVAGLLMLAGPEFGTGVPPDRAGWIDRGAVPAGDADSASESTHEAPVAPPHSATTRFARGLVRDDTGASVAGARVLSAPDDLEEMLDADPTGPGRAARTDLTGRFEAPLAGDAATHALLVLADGWAPALVTGVRADDEVEVALTRAGRLVGWIVDRSGRAVPGASVHVLAVFDRYRRDWRLKSDDRGEFRVDGVPVRAAAGSASGLGVELAVEVRAEGFAPRIERFVELPAPDGERRLELVIGPGATIAGEVIDGATGEALAGAEVLVWGSVEGTSTAVVEAGGRTVRPPFGVRPLGRTGTATDGRFTLSCIPVVGPSLILRVGAVRPGFTAAWVGVGRDTLEAESITIRLWPAGAVEGRVVDPEGTPVGGVMVVTERDGAPVAWSFPAIYEPVAGCVATTDATGRFRIRGVAVGAPDDPPCVLRVYPKSVTFASGRPATAMERTFTGLAGQTVDVGDIEIPSFLTRAADFVVTDEAGKPVAGAVFTTTGLPLSLSPRTDRGGQARLQWGADGDEVARGVIVRAAGFGPVAVRVTPDAAAPPVVRVVLAAGRTLTGTVLHAEGNPAVDVRVEVANACLSEEEAFKPALVKTAAGALRAEFPPLRVYAQVRTDASGTFMVADLPAGPWFVRALAYAREDGTSIEPPIISTPVRIDYAEDQVLLLLPPE
jgi:hypothetical protein